MATTQHKKGERFRALHEDGPFVIPNPWDAGSAKVLAGLGFEALATTSSGFAFTLGRHDGGVTLDEVVEHTRVLVEAVELPISVDLENGYGAQPEQAAAAIERAAEAGAVGGSIEDYDPGDDRIYEPDHAAERIAAAVEAARALDFPFTLTARAENHIRGNPDLDDTIARLQAFERAGADVLYAPGLRTLDEIRTVCDATTKPVNVLARPKLPLADVFEAGAQRVSLGGSLAFVAVAAMAEAAEAIRDSGDFGPITLGPKLRDWLAAARLGLERRVDRDVDVALQRAGDRAVLTCASRRVRERVLVDARDAAMHDDVRGLHALAGDEVHRRLGLEPLRRRPRLGELVRERHAVAGRVCGCEQFLGARLAGGTLGA